MTLRLELTEASIFIKHALVANYMKCSFKRVQHELFATNLVRHERSSSSTHVSCIVRR
uniref:Uncharacterized protein n=1 Tax=Anguilla anguilla TaxID=7936 RepID=A0A0E9RTT3_ANGAN